MKHFKILCVATVLAIFSCCDDGQVKMKDYVSYLDNYSSQGTVVSRHGGVCSAHPLASKVGIYILEHGGNAVDAAVAMQLALAVVYPQAGNIGGGGFMVMRLKDGTTKALDFRETAPAAASANMYLDAKGQVDYSKSLGSHLAVGVPGTIAGISESLKYCKLPLSTLIQPAIDLAQRGYTLSWGLAYDFTSTDARRNTMPNAFDSTHHWKDGDTLRQPDLAKTLTRIRDKGCKEFYEGETAKLIVEEMKRGRGLISMEDLKNYRAKWREPYRFNYRGYDILSMPLPSSGGILMHQMMKMIEPYPVASYGYGSVKEINLLVEAERRAYRDRAKYLGDPDFSDIPVKKITDEAYLREQMKDFVPGKAGKSVPPENISEKHESRQTTHLSVVDAEGNAVAVTTTLNGQFGCGTVVGGAGFFLNNEMDDFSKKTGTRSGSGGIGGVANAIAPGKRMLSSMSPTIVTKDGKLFMVVGTPGGTTIPTSVSQSIINVIDFKMSATDAIRKSMIHHEWWPDKVMVGGGIPEDTVNALKKMGYDVFYGTGASLEAIKIVEDAPLYEVTSQRGSAEGY
jgi:gamma-glutamyltranspeptidase/glutathione hydrolase